MQQATLPAPRWQPPTIRTTPRSSTPSSTAQTAARSAVQCEQLAQRGETTAAALAADWDARLDRLRAQQAGTP